MGMQDDDDIDYRILLAASSEEDLVLFEKDLWTGGSSSLTSTKTPGAKSKQSQSPFTWSDKLVLNVKSLFQSRNERHFLPEPKPETKDAENDTVAGELNAQPPTKLGLGTSDSVQNGVAIQEVNDAGLWSNHRAVIGRLWSSAKPRSRLNNGDCIRITSLVSIEGDTADHTGDNGTSTGSGYCGTELGAAVCSRNQSLLHSKSESWSTQRSCSTDDGNILDSSKDYNINSLECNEEVADMPGKHFSALDGQVDEVGLGESEEDPLFGGNRKSSDVYYKGETTSWRRRLLAFMLVILILSGAIACGVALGVIYGRDDSEPSTRTGYVYRDAAVAADAARCSEIGRDMLLNKGSAMDAAIAGLLCVGLYNAHSTGIGGGSFIMYYERENKTPYFLDSREVAPILASTDMYTNESSDASTTGGLAIAVPGEIMGYWEAHQRFGRLPWGNLFKPSIELAENGFTVGPALARAIDQNSDRIMNDPSLREVMLDENGNILKENGTMYRRKLAQTMRTLAAEGAVAFYNGSLSVTIATEIEERGGIVSVDDLAQYQVAVKTPLDIEISGHRTYTCPPPCSGAVFSLIMNILEGYEFTPESLQSVGDETLTYHRIIEAFKFAYAKRSALGDEDFVDVADLVANLTSQDYADSIRARITDDRTHDTDYYDPSFKIVEDGGTSHISVVDQFGNAASITSTINTYFGSKVRGNNTGIIFNNEMDDFSKPGAPNYYGVPPSPSNFIIPGKRPLSSMTPVIMVDEEGDVELVVGASGGTRITTATSLVTMETLWFGSSLEDGVERRRVHNQLIPNATRYEVGFPQEVVDGLVSKGQDVEENSGIAVVQVIHRLEDQWLGAYCDSRKDGRPSGF
ncbi:glutathione hydrolase 1 proenzyme-like isoform X1 [Lytechinus variegatus]|uniref:glutathione hydrolase 1 proenzyme-like isoform X1 n=1 Tax=Lytechinus variegatus TaxID=7654 RepID=UPI001BB2951C|nr:glutathione hydrolase 1 proenzyme-like isoform X1 [Lytechinus variegatus]